MQKRGPRAAGMTEDCALVPSEGVAGFCTPVLVLVVILGLLLYLRSIVYVKVRLVDDVLSELVL